MHGAFLCPKVTANTKCLAAFVNAALGMIIFPTETGPLGIRPELSENGEQSSGMETRTGIKSYPRNLAGWGQEIDIYVHICVLSYIYIYIYKYVIYYENYI